MRRLRLLPLLAAMTGSLLVPLAAPASAAPVTPLLVAVRAAHHPGYDRVVFQFRGGLPSSRSVTYVTRLIGDGSGLPVPIAGRAILQVRFFPADAHDTAGHATIPARTAYALPNVLTTVRSGDFEAVTTYGIGLASRQPVHVFTLTNPSRVVVDVRAAFPTLTRRVWFFNQKRFVANTLPFFTPVSRPILPSLPATTLMDRLYAGPTPAEQAAGLRLLQSRSTGFTALTVNSGIAHLRLVGGCSSGGSTVTIAGEIFPTLRQLLAVDFVKIYFPAHQTERPTGRVDSIPECLEP